MCAVLLQAMQRFPDADKELKDKFLVQSAFIDPDPSIDVIEHWKGLQERERREQVKPYAEKKLKSVLEVPGRVSLPALNFFGNSISFVRNRQTVIEKILLVNVLHKSVLVDVVGR